MKKVKLVYFSPAGSTKKAAQLIGRAWEEAEEIDVTSYSEKDKQYEFAQDEAAVFGVPSFGGRVPATAAERFAKIKGNGTPAVALTTFGNRAYDDTLHELAEILKKQGFRVIRINALKGNGLGEVTETARSLMKEKIEKLKARGRINVPIRSMIVGIPNVGKSTFINKYVGKVTAKTGDKPGVTRGKQWIKLKKDFELLDTPGILWPKFEDQQVGLKLAFTGAINDDILDPENMALAFINHMISRNPDCLRNRYQITFDTIEEPHVILEKIAMARGFKKKGGEPDLERAGKILMDEYRGGKLGRLTLELPEDIDVMLEQKKARAAEKAVLDKERKKAYNNKKKK